MKKPAKGSWARTVAKIEPCHKALGKRIRHIRITIGIDQETLAKKVGLDRTSVVNAEGGRQRFLLHSVERYASALGTTPRYLLKGIWI